MSAARRWGTGSSTWPIHSMRSATPRGAPFQPILLAAVAVPTNEAEPGRGIRHPRQRGDRDILSLLLAETPGEINRGSPRPRGRRAPRRDEAGTVDPVRDHAHTVRGPPSTRRPFRLFLRHGDDRAQRGEVRLIHRYRSPPPDQPRPVVGRDDHPGRRRPARSPPHGRAPRPSTSAGAPRHYPRASLRIVIRSERSRGAGWRARSTACGRPGASTCSPAAPRHGLGAATIAAWPATAASVSCRTHTATRRSPAAPR